MKRREADGILHHHHAVS